VLKKVILSSQSINNPRNRQHIQSSYRKHMCHFLARNLFYKLILANKESRKQERVRERQRVKAYQFLAT
jgi:hypothetical protein